VRFGETPRRRPLACGALGGYDRALVQRIADELGVEMRVAHQDDTSLLLLDRPAINWRARDRRGFAWSEDAALRGRARSWREAACELSACGLVVEPGRRRAHSSVSGVAPVYWLEHDGAVYFASRIDPLVRALPGRLSVDWRAWASIFYLRFPLGTRTPFREVRRLRPFSTLEWDATRDRVRAHEAPWPWAEVEPSLDLEEGADALVSEMGDAVASLAGRPTVCTLSGGRDSRLILCLLKERGAGPVRAITVSPDNGHRREEELAARVAAELGVPHAAVEGRDEDFWEDTRARALRVDYQLAAPPWAMPLAAALRAERATVTDGLGLDTLAQAGSQFFTEEMLHADGTPAVARALWRRMLGTTMRRMVPTTLSRELGQALKPLARHQFLRESRRFRGHPAEAALTFYATRTLRGTSLAPHALLGAELATVTPFTRHGVAHACLAIRPIEKFNDRIYRAIFARVNSKVGGLPSTHDEAPKPAARRPRRGLSPAAIRGYERVLADGPLTPALSSEVRGHLAQGTLGEALRDPVMHRGALAVSLFHLWHERYADRLGDADPLGDLELRGDAVSRDRLTTPV
jgi:hypothetical protein